MAASQVWIRTAAILVANEVGPEEALRLVRKLRALPGANRSVAVTLEELVQVVTDICVEEGVAV